MNLQEYISHIKIVSPKIVYLYGTTAVGKSTLARALVDDFSYEMVDLEQMIVDEIAVKFSLDIGETFIKVNRGHAEPEWIEHYIKKVHEAISTKVQDRNIVIECPIKYAPTVHQILDPYEGLYEFVFILPTGKQVYIGRLLQRIVRHKEGRFGLPNMFWSTVDEKDKEKFFKDFEVTEAIKKAVEEYAEEQMARSENLLEELQQTFKLITVEV